jgi:hypothetical protein
MSTRSFELVKHGPRLGDAGAIAFRFVDRQCFAGFGQCLGFVPERTEDSREL